MGKASGFALSTITEDGFAVMDRQKLDIISEKVYSENSFERESQIKDDLAIATITKDKRPSVETSFHNAINYKFVIHLHPTLVNGIMCSNNVEELIVPVFGTEGNLHSLHRSGLHFIQSGRNKSCGVQSCKRIRSKGNSASKSRNLCKCRYYPGSDRYLRRHYCKHRKGNQTPVDNTILQLLKM